MNDYVVKGGDTLGAIAQKNNTSVSELAKINNIANANYIQSGQTLKLPKIVSPSPDTVNNNADFGKVTSPSTEFKGSLTPPQVPVPQVNTSYAKLAQDEIKANSAPNPYEAERDQLIAQMKSDLNLNENKGNDTVALNNEKGVYKNKQLVNDISSEILALGAETDSNKLMVDANMAGTTKSGLELIKNDIDRVKAIKSITLNARLIAAQGNVAQAEQEVKDAIDAKYSPIEARLKNYETFLNLNKDKLERYDKKAYDNQQMLLNAKIKDLDQSKATEKSIQSMVVNAAKQNAPKDLLTQAGNAKTEAEAATILGPYAGDYFQYQELKNRMNEYNKANLSKNTAIGGITKDVGFSIDDFKKGISGVESAGSTDAYGGKDQYKVINGQRTIQDIRNMTQSQKDNVAYGKYQVMGYNIPKWTKQALGRSLTIEEFLNDPSAQEAVFEQQSEQNYAKYGNWDDVASVWFSGKPAKGNYNSDGSNTVPEYISKYRDKMGVGSTTSNISVANLTSDQQKQYNDIINEVNTNIKNDLLVSNSLRNLESTAKLAKEGNAASQISLVFSYMKALDPNSTVREGEFATVQNAAGVPERVINMYNKARSGEFLTNDQIDQIINEAKGRDSVARQNIDRTLADAEYRASQFRIPKGVISGYYQNRIGGQQTPQSTTGNQTWDNFLNSATQIYGTNANSTVSLTSYSQGFTR